MTDGLTRYREGVEVVRHETGPSARKREDILPILCSLEPPDFLIDLSGGRPILPPADELFDGRNWLWINPPGRWAA